MANQTITDLPAAGALTGAESVPIVQGGITVRTTTGAIAASPSLTQTFLTLNNEPTLPNSRYFSVGTGLGLTDNGAQSNLVLNLTGASGSLESAGNGFIVKTASNTVTSRTLTTSGGGLSLTNGSGVSGNPNLSLTGLPAALAGLSGGGIVVAVDPSTLTQRSIIGTANQIAVLNGSGVSANPAIGLANNTVIPGTGAVTIPVGTTAQRPVGQDGQIRYNTDINGYEVYDAGVWTTISAGAVTSIDASGGTTGMTFTGGPITSAGVLTLGGTLAVANGGTNGSAAPTAGAVSYGTGTAYAFTAAGAASEVLLSGGSGAPTWAAQSSLSVGSASTATTATNVAGGAANRIVYNTSSGATTFIIAPTVANTFLEWSGTAFQWSANPLGTVTSVDVSGGTTGLTTSGGPITASGTITLSGTLNVANGGTGATTLTGYVKGNGTSAFTASATIPNTDITGLGTMSTQGASSVAITGGNINGTTIGNTTPGAGTFTSVAMTSGTITSTPSSGTDIVNKTYADSIAAGINFHQSCRLATTTALPSCTYNNGTSGVGATLTATANGALSVDTTAVASTNRILVKNQANQAHNGVYVVTQAGDGSNPFILTRATDFNTPGTGVNQIDAGDFFLITAGSTLANTSWVQQTPLPITVGTTNIVFQQFGAPLVYSPGTGLSESPAYTFNIANTGVTATTYGSASSVPVIGVNAQGQITSASNSTIAIAASQITSGQIAIANGGTNATATPTAGAIAYGTGTAYAFSSAGSSTQVLLSGGSGAPTWTNQSSLSVGSATTATDATNATNTAITDDTITNATVYPTWVTSNTGNLPQKVTSTKFTFNPSTGVLTATGGISGGTF